MSANGVDSGGRCHQYERRLELNEDDLTHCPFPRQQLKADSDGLWRVVVTNLESDFRLVPVPKGDISRLAEIEDFILRYEWLGSMPHRPTYYFTVRTTAARGDMLVGAVVMAAPMAFSKLLGEDTKHHETLIARGAVISWAPRNLNSWLLSRAIGWMTANTPHRLFVGYGDPRANEIGTIYQSLNLYYLGQDYGVTSAFLDPETSNPLYPTGCRHPRHLAMYQRYAEEVGIEWNPIWSRGTRVNWRHVPPEVAVTLRRKAKAHERRLVRVPLPPKHKYAMVKGATRKETQHLRKLFEKRNAALIQPYPSEERRGALSPLPAQDAQPRLVRLTDVQPEEVTWLWRDRIPCGKLTLLEGDPDEGKSTVAYDLAARVSAGRPMPLDGTPREPAGVIILSAEDGLADTIRPRLEAADANLDRIRAFAFEALPTIPDDLTAIERAIAEVGARLVIIDPLVAFFGRAVHAYRDHDVRRALTPLAALADRTTAAVLAIRHLNKARMARAKYRGSGSIGILGAARSALLVARDPEDPNRRLLAPVKQNLSVGAPAVAFSLVPAGTAARVAWLGETAHRLTQRKGSLLTLRRRLIGRRSRMRWSSFGRRSQTENARTPWGAIAGRARRGKARSTGPTRSSA